MHKADMIDLTPNPVHEITWAPKETFLSLT